MRYLGNFDEILTKDVTYDNIKRLYPLSLKNTFLKKKILEIDPPPLFRVKRQPLNLFKFHCYVTSSKFFPA